MAVLAGPTKSPLSRFCPLQININFNVILNSHLRWYVYAWRKMRQSERGIAKCCAKGFRRDFSTGSKRCTTNRYPDKKVAGKIIFFIRFVQLEVFGFGNT